MKESTHLKPYAKIKVDISVDNTTHSKLLSGIISELELIGYECKKGMGHGCECYICRKDDVKLIIALYAFSLFNNKHSIIQCSNAFPWYKNMFCKIPREERYTGKKLEEFLEYVKEIVSKDNRYIICEWMERR